MTAGNPPKPPARAGTIPGVAPAGKPTATAKPAPAAPAVRPQPAAVTPTAPAVKPAESLGREDIRGIAQAIARAETATLREDLVARLTRIEERIASLEKRPATPPAPAVAPAPVPIAAPVPVAAPVPAPAPAPLFATPPPLPVMPVAQPVAPPPAPIDFDVHVSLDEDDLPFVSGARRRKRMAVILVMLLLATVGTIVIAAIVSQAVNNHSKSQLVMPALVARA